MNPFIQLSKYNNKLSHIKISNYSRESVIIKIVNTSKMLNNFFDLLSTSYDEWENYISKAALSLNVDEIREIIKKSSRYKHLIDGQKEIVSKNFIKKSILFFGKNKVETILHVYLKKEPDIYSD